MADTTAPRSSTLLEILKLPAVQITMLALVSALFGSVGTLYGQPVVAQMLGAPKPEAAKMAVPAPQPTMRDLHALLVQAGADAGYCAKQINAGIERLPNPLRPPQMPVGSSAKK